MGPVIDLDTLFPWRIWMLVVHSFVLFNMAHSCLKDKYHPLATLSAIFAVRLTTSLLFYHYLDWRNALGIILFMLLSFAVLMIFTDGRIYRKIIVITSFVLCYFLNALLMALVEGLVYHDYEEKTAILGEYGNKYHLVIYVISCFMMITLSYAFAGVLKVISARKGVARNKKIFAYFYFLPISHVFSFIYFIMATPTDLQRESFGPVFDTVFVVLSILIGFFDISFPFVFDYFEKLIERNNENESIILKNQMDYEQIELYKSEKQEFRKLKHDYANIITTAVGLIEIGQVQKAASMLSKTNEDIAGASQFSLCADETVNTVLYLKTNQAKKEGISLDCRIDESYPVLIDSYDLCRVLCNLLDNGLNAAGQAQHDRSLTVAVTVAEDVVAIKTENAVPTGRTRHSRGGEHGNGIGIIRDIVKKYDGGYSFSVQNSIYITETVMKNRSL